MVADLMHEDMGDDGAESLLVLGPIIEDRSAVEEHMLGMVATSDTLLRARSIPE